MKRVWKKPELEMASFKDISSFINVAARSGGGGDGTMVLGSTTHACWG